MGLFNGIAIPDPRKGSNQNFNTKEGARDGGVSSEPIKDIGHTENTLNDDQNPHIPVDNNQEKFAETLLQNERTYESVKLHREDDEVTVPYTSDLREDIEDDKVYEEEQDLKADVEEPVLEAGKRVKDTFNPRITGRDVGGGNAQYNPDGTNPDATFTKEELPKLRPEYLSSALYTEAKDFVDEKHYQTIITTHNQWMDPYTGRVHLFEDLRQSSRDNDALDDIRGI